MLRYLYGPGKQNEHTDPHLVAGWDEPGALEPPVSEAGTHITAPLAQLLNQPLKAAVGNVDPRQVWQCSVRAAPGDRRLSDAEWAQIAADVVDRCGFAPAGDEAGCRWVAMRHAEDHIHILVTLARQDGRSVRPRNDYYRVGEACRAAEERYGAKLTAGRDRTAGSNPTYGEDEKAKRQGLPEPARVTLRRHVRAAAAASSGVDGFLEHLRDRGLLVKERLSTTTAGQITGYAVALPAVRTVAGGPVWYGGGKLAADLSLPKLRRRWTEPAEPPAAATRLDAGQRAAVWAQAQRSTAAATVEIRRLAGTNPAAAADIAWATADALTVAARLVDGGRLGALTRAADTYDRAARELWGRTPTRAPAGTALRGMARALALTGRARHDETAQLMALIMNITALAQAVAQLREAQHRAAQAAAARSAAEQLHLITAGARTRQPTATRTEGAHPTAPRRPGRHR